MPESTTTWYVPTETPELKAMGLIETAMSDLCNGERWRVARWVADRWQQPAPLKGED